MIETPDTKPEPVEEKEVESFVNTEQSTTAVKPIYAKLSEPVSIEMSTPEIEIEPLRTVMKQTSPDKPHAFVVSENTTDKHYSSKKVVELDLSKLQNESYVNTPPEEEQFVPMHVIERRNFKK